MLNDICLDIKAGEFVTFFGPNGCGKTTLLKVLAGIELPDSGTVLIDSKSPVEAKTGLIFQNYHDSLMPWLTCEQNILFSYSLRKRRAQAEDAHRRLRALLDDLNLHLPLGNYPYELSGGQQQLTAILRTLIYEPDVILMDEPFSALDFQTRAFMQQTLLEIWHRERPTILFVSHEIDEALFLADRLVLLTPLPATITQIIEVPFPRPRLNSVLEDDDFFHLKRTCLQIVRAPTS